MLAVSLCASTSFALRSRVVSTASTTIRCSSTRMVAEGLPKAVVFDLDGCLWYPDMYMLWGGGAPFELRSDGDLDDRNGQRVYLLGAVRDILYELKTDARWEGAVVAVASCTDEPDWAQECMRKFEVGPVGSGVMIKDVMQLEEIRKNNKRVHLTNIAEATGLDFSEMLFLDNERGNCMDVASLGVTVAFVPEGVTAGSWQRALEAFPAPGEILDNRKGL